MNGRLEDEQKIFNKIEDKINTMPDYMYKWYLNLRANQTTAASCMDYIRKVDRFLSTINIVNIEDITLEMVQQYFISIQVKKDKNGQLVRTSDSYRISVWSALNNFFNFLKNAHYISDNYMAYIQKGKNDDLARINKSRILLTEKDFVKIINQIKKQKHSSRYEDMTARDICIVYLFMSTGMRRTALTEINIDSIDYNNKNLIIIDKGDKEQIYPLEDDILQLIDQWKEIRANIILQKNTSTDALFISKDGNRLTGNSIYKLIEKYSSKALGYKISPHKLRSGFCSIMFNKTKDIESVRRAVGHSNIATTQRYIVTNNNERKDAASYMSKTLNLGRLL